MTISKTDSGFVRGVSSLNGLVCEGKIFANYDVEVLLGDLRFLHDPETTLRAHLCQEKMVLPTGVEPVLRFLENPRPAVGPQEHYFFRRFLSISGGSR